MTEQGQAKDKDCPLCLAPRMKTWTELLQLQEKFCFRVAPGKYLLYCAVVANSLAKYSSVSAAAHLSPTPILHIPSTFYTSSIGARFAKKRSGHLKVPSKDILIPSVSAKAARARKVPSKVKRLLCFSELPLPKACKLGGTLPKVFLVLFPSHFLTCQLKTSHSSVSSLVKNESLMNHKSMSKSNRQKIKPPQPHSIHVFSSSNDCAFVPFAIRRAAFLKAPTFWLFDKTKLNVSTCPAVSSWKEPVLYKESAG